MNSPAAIHTNLGKGAREQFPLLFHKRDEVCEIEHYDWGLPRGPYAIVGFKACVMSG